MKRFTLVSVCLVLLVSLIGCGGTTTVGSESEEHLEHFVPPHKPASYSDLVKSLRDRMGQLPADGTPSETQTTELLDVIRWIPEIAADSDLRRSDWEAAAATSVTMERLFHECFNGSVDGKTATGNSDGSQSGAAAGSARERFEPLISKLEQMVIRATIDNSEATGFDGGSSEADVSDREANHVGDQ